MPPSPCAHTLVVSNGRNEWWTSHRTQLEISRLSHPWLSSRLLRKVQEATHLPAVQADIWKWEPLGSLVSPLPCNKNRTGKIGVNLALLLMSGLIGWSPNFLDDLQAHPATWSCDLQPFISPALNQLQVPTVSAGAFWMCHQQHRLVDRARSPSCRPSLFLFSGCLDDHLSFPPILALTIGDTSPTRTS